MSYFRSNFFNLMTMLSGLLWAIGMAWENFRSPAGPIHSCDGGLIASAATLAPQGYISRVSGTTAIDNITLPYTGFAGSIVLIPTGAFTTTTSGNVGLASTGVVGKALIMTYCPSAAKWYPSY